jgi:TonB-dependent receptor
MRSLRILKKFVVSLLICLSGLASAYGSGTLQGRVTSTEGEPLPFANIVITHKIEGGQRIELKSQIGAVTDLDGYFVISSLSTGKFVVHVIYIGYEAQEFEVAIENNQSFTLNVVLASKSTNLEEVVISAQSKGQMAAINQQLAAISIKNVVSTDRIQNNPDANAAESIGRLPGVSVTRSGGEANDIVIRGMAPEYNKVLLNGIEIPSNKGTSRNANLSGISQSSLQGIEVYKSLTPDMDANSVSGTVNMLLQTARSGLHSSLTLQGGYNNQNNDWKNYKIFGEVSNRFFEDKLGVSFGASVERVNRSTQTLAASYAIESNNAPEGEFEPMYINGIGLNDISNIIHRSSGTLVFDYRFSPKSTIQFSNFFSYNPTDNFSMSKNFNPKSGVDYNTNQSKGDGYIYSGAVIGKHTLGIIQLDYGTAYSLSNSHSKSIAMNVHNPFGFNPEDGTQEKRSLPLVEIINMANDAPTPENLKNFGLYGPGSDGEDWMDEKQFDAHLDVTVPFKLTDFISGKVKAGGQYKHKNRSHNADYKVYGGPPFHKLISGIQQTGDGIDWALPWVSVNTQQAVSMENMIVVDNSKFLQGTDYSFGWVPDINKLDEVYNWWQDITGYYLGLGGDAWQPIFGQERMISYYDLRQSVVNDNTVAEDYYAGYAMAEISIGKKIDFIPGVRYENMKDDMTGWFVQRALDEGIRLPGHTTSASQQNGHFFPMVHLKIKPIKWATLQFSYTQTIHRPDYNSIIPFEYLENGLKPFSYTYGNPDLKPELWTNYDVMLSIFNNKIGLLSLNGFYKTVQDKIWYRSWMRVTSDPVVSTFASNDEVLVGSWYNNEYNSTVKGFEIEWQTDFRFLPRPFNLFSLTANYSILKNETTYPFSEVNIVQTGTTSGGRPIFEKVRSDSTFTGMMINQPKSLANVSLGFSYKKFDIYVSFQYIGAILTNRAVQEEFDNYKNAFYRWGLQGKLGLPIKGMELLFNVANLNNIQEKQYNLGDSRPTYVESYGWTADLGFRYSF